MLLLPQPIPSTDSARGVLEGHRRRFVLPGAGEKTGLVAGDLGAGIFGV